MLISTGAYNWNNRLRVVSNFGDSGEIHARAKMGSREETRLIFGAPPRGASPRGSPFSRACVFRRNCQN